METRHVISIGMTHNSIRSEFINRVMDKLKKKRQAIKYDTVDGPGCINKIYINQFTSFALNASNARILFENDRRCSFLMHTHFLRNAKRAF